LELLQFVNVACFKCCGIQFLQHLQIPYVSNYDGHANSNVQLTDIIIVLLSGHFPSQEVVLLRAMLILWTHHYN
jgi:hypothetical protein